eukprot:500645_1
MQAKDTDEMVINEGGDFEVQIHIQQLILRYSSIAKDLGVSSDPVVTVTIMEQQKSTKKINKQLNVTLDQILCFSLKALKPQQLLKTKCIIQVFDHNNNIIGSFELNLRSVYYKKNHEMCNQWLALKQHGTIEQLVDEQLVDEQLVDEQDNITGEIQCLLKASVCVLGANDEHYIHDENKDVIDNNGEILWSSSNHSKPYKLTIKIYAYRDLAMPKNDTLSLLQRYMEDIEYYNKEHRKITATSSELKNMTQTLSHDAKEEINEKKENQLNLFCVVEFGGVRLSSVGYDFGQCVGTSNDKVFVKFEIPIMEPTVGDEIKIEFWHKDSNNLISIIRENYYVIKQENYINKPRWYYMYGAPIGHDKNKYGKDMNNGCIDGTYFRGQSLIEMYITQQKQKPKPSPLFDTFEAKEEVALNTFETINDEINIICDIYHGTEMYRVGKEMFIEIAIGRQYKQIAIVKSDIKICLGDANYKREIWNINKKLQLTISG